MVFQSKSVDLKLTAAENLWHQGHLYGLRGATLKVRIQEMLERVALADRAKDKVETFSGGMQRRVELAKGLMHRPSVLLLDEPTTGLDPGARRDLWLYLNELRAQEKVSIIVTTHLMEEAEHCDRLAILNLGEIVGLGTPAELRSQIGGDVVMLEAADPAALAQRIQERFQIATTALDGKVRLEIKDGLEICDGRGGSHAGNDPVGFHQQADAGRCIYQPHGTQILDGARARLEANLTTDKHG